MPQDFVRIAALSLLFATVANFAHGATFVVTTLADSGPGSLRQAITDANAAGGSNTIAFQSNLSGVLWVHSFMPTITGSVQIVGPGAATLNIRRLNTASYPVLNFSGSTGQSLAVSGLTISNGSASSSQSGGGINIGNNTFGTITITGCLFEDNLGALEGSAVCARAQNISISDCTFRFNTALSGAALYVSATSAAGSAVIERCTFVSNVGVLGALRVAAGTGAVRVLNCTIDGNFVPDANGVAGVLTDLNSTAANCLFCNCTITNNSTTSTFTTGVGGVSVTNFGAPRFLNCIIAGNTHAGANSNISGTVASLGHNLVSDPTGGTMVASDGDLFGSSGSPLDPQLAPLADNGGSTLTRALLSNSPAINAGTIFAAPLLDQRGRARVGPPDMGAYESVPDGPEIDVRRAGVGVASGGTDTLADVLFAPGASRTVQYEVINTAGGTLLLPSPALLDNFSNCGVVPGTPPLSVLSGSQSTMLALAITPVAAGPFGFRVTLPSNDADENPYIWNVAGVAIMPAPELDVFQGAAAVASGSGFAAGTTFAAGVGTPLAFTLRNTGTAPLTLEAPGTFSAFVNCAAAVSGAPSSPVAAGGQTTATLAIIPTAAGAFSFTWSLPNNDPNENPYTISVNGTAGAAAPDIDISRASAPLPNGALDFLGTRPVASFSVFYDIRNFGTAALTFTPPGTFSMLTNCTVAVSQAPASPVAVQTATQMILLVTPQAVGSFYFRYSLTSNDPDESPATFMAGGIAGTDVAPEIALARGAIPVTDGGTDTATGAVAGVPMVLTYTVSNSGNGELILATPLGGPQGLVNCVVAIAVQPAGNVAPASTTTFGVEITPSAAGAFNLTVWLGNNDANEDPFTFTISGMAAATAPEINVTRGAAPVAAGGTDNVGTISVGGPQALSYTISNLGTALLSLTGTSDPVVVTPGTNVSIVTVTSPPATSVPAQGSTQFSISVTIAAAGPFELTVSVENDDADENPYTWTITGMGNANVTEIEVARQGLPVADDSTEDAGVMLTAVAATLTYTIGNTGGGTLNLTGTPPVVVSGAVNCTAVVGTQSGATIDASGFDTFTIVVTPASPGAFAFFVSIPNNDADENPYNWIAIGAAVAAAQPQVDEKDKDDGLLGCGAGAGTLSATILALFLLTGVRRYRS